MTDTFHSFTVVLEHDTRDDEARYILNAIKMIKGVQSVTGQVADIDSHMAEVRARNELGKKLLDVVYPDRKSR